jgi:hypothetical protein
LGIFFAGCGEDQPVGLANRTLDPAGKPAPIGDPGVSATDPAEAPQDTTLDVRVLGSNFDRGSRADLALNCEVECVLSEKIKTNSTRYVSSTELVANITIAVDATVDRYDVLVTTSRGKRGIGIELFAVKVGHPNPQTGYTKLILDLPRSTSCEARAVNDREEVVGSCYLRKGGRHAFYWSSGTGTLDLGPGGADALSELDGPVVAGWRDGNVPVVWDLASGFTPVDLPQACSSPRLAITSAGDRVAGSGCFTVDGAARILPAVWSRSAGGGWSAPQALPLPVGYESGNAFAMSGNGIVIGTLFPIPPGVQGNEWFVWFPPYLQAERLPLGGYAYVNAQAINDSGAVAGSSSSVSPWRSLYWMRNGTFWDPPSDIGEGSAKGINNADFLTGNAGNLVYIWSAATGTLNLGQGIGFDINEGRDVAGMDNLASEHAAVWLAP